MEMSSGPVTGTQIAQAVPTIVEILEENKIKEVFVSHGWGSRLRTDELWKPIRIKTSDLTAFCNSSTEDNIFRPGSSDLFIEDEAKTFQFLLCHESDIHLNTESRTLIDQTRERWEREGYSIRLREN